MQTDNITIINCIPQTQKTISKSANFKSPSGEGKTPVSSSTTPDSNGLQAEGWPNLKAALPKGEMGAGQGGRELEKSVEEVSRYQNMDNKDKPADKVLEIPLSWPI